MRDWANAQGWDTTPPAPELPADVVEQTRGEVRRGLRADHREVTSDARARVLIRPKEGILDPQGKAVERALPALGFEGIEHVRVGRMVELEAEDPAQLDELCEKLLANPLIEDYEIRDPVIWGVLQFPGSCDERDALHACELAAGEARLVWHEETDLSGVDGIVVPGGFSYGDYLRAGAIARFAPAMEAVAEFAAAGGPVLGICNGFQVLCEAGLLPGALLPNRSCASSAARSSSIAARRRLDLARRGIDGGERSRSRSSTGAAATTRRPEMLDGLEANGQVAFRYAEGHNPNGSVRDIAGVTQRGRQRDRADAPSRARGRRADRLDRRARAVPGAGRGSRRERRRRRNTASSA